MIKISDLQAKDVVNVQDGQKLGQIHDVEIDLKMGQIKAIVVPAESKLFGLISGEKSGSFHGGKSSKSERTSSWYDYIPLRHLTNITTTSLLHSRRFYLRRLRIDR